MTDPLLRDAARVAVVDLGSNTCRLVVFRVDEQGHYWLEDEIREVVRLRSGFSKDGLSRSAMRRGMAVLRLYSRFCRELDISRVIPAATSAVRDAANGREFCADVAAETGWTLRVLSPVEEARLGAEGVLEEVHMSDGFVVDIGGGSAQLSRVSDGRFERGAALPLGALRLTERFVSSDPPAGKEVAAVRQAVRDAIHDLDWARHGRDLTLAGIGGSIRNLAYIDHADRSWPFRSVRGFVLSRERLDAIVEQLLTTPLAGRRQISGLNADRADIICAGAVVLQEIMGALGAKGVHISVAGLREGLFLEHLRQGAPGLRGTDLRRFAVRNLGRRYGVLEDHSERVAALAVAMHEDLQPVHGLPTGYSEILASAGWLHDVGTAVGYHDHHKHGQFLVAQNGLPGFSASETALIALLARYHRKGNPTPGPFGQVLLEADAKALPWLAASLRMAEYLERGRTGNVRDVQIQLRGDAELQVMVSTAGDASVEIWDAQRRAVPLLERLSGRTVRMLAM